MAIKLKYTNEFDVSIGKYANETNWKNTVYDWQDFVNRISVTHRTHEKYEVYCNLKKDKQDAIKDIGGFVGGYLANGRRKAKNVLHRQLITLDVESTVKFTVDEFEEALADTWWNAAAIYTTHKHNPKKPRLRLVIPLDREVPADQYEAIARKIAGEINIEWFDPTTFQPNRLMYWPSTSKDGTFEFWYQDAKFLKADKVLDMYHDWTDSTQWPFDERFANAHVNALKKKQDDPLEKDNIIGSFCRTHDIHDAIALYLSDYYEQGTDDRYTYLEGSTANGLVTYDDKFAYSHHGTDPISGQLCNAFDLVRIHLFGLKDENAKEGTPSTRLPSYQAMLNLASKDKDVKRKIGKERTAAAQAEFSKNFEEDEFDPWKDDEADEDLPKNKKRDRDTDDDDDEDDDSDEWVEKLTMDKRGKYDSTIANVAIILENDPLLKGKFVFNSFTNRKEVKGNLPWRKVLPAENFFTDDDTPNVNKYLEKYYNITVRANIKDALAAHFASHAYHPVRNYFKSLEPWDELKRLDTLLVEYLGAEDTPYTRAVTRKTFVAAVARIFQPGCKFDHVLTLSGEEDKGKSTLINKMGMQWFSASFNFSMLHSVRAVEQLQGVWIIEIPELVGLNKADGEAVKNFITIQEDIFRKSYGEFTLPYKRQCIFIATTNNLDFLQKSINGHRRWWPVDILHTEPVRDMFTQLDSEEVNQLWAEALHYYDEGEELFLNKELKAIAKKIQQQHTEVDERAGIIERYLNTLFPDDWDEMEMYARHAFLNGNDMDEREGTELKHRVCVAQLWAEALKGDPKTMVGITVKDIHNIMRQMPGWKPYKSKTDFGGYGTQRGYFRDNVKQVFSAVRTAVSKN